MSRWTALLILLVCTTLFGGCSMCCAPYDDEYPMLQSERYPRLNPLFGRVGSPYSDPNLKTGDKPRTNADLPADENVREPLDQDLEDPNFQFDTETRVDLEPLNPEEPSTEPLNINTSAGLIPSWR